MRSLVSRITVFKARRQAEARNERAHLRSLRPKYVPPRRIRRRSWFRGPKKWKCPGRDPEPYRIGPGDIMPDIMVSVVYSAKWDRALRWHRSKRVGLSFVSAGAENFGVAQLGSSQPSENQYWGFEWQTVWDPSWGSWFSTRAVPQWVVSNKPIGNGEMEVYYPCDSASEHPLSQNCYCRFCKTPAMVYGGQSFKTCLDCGLVASVWSMKIPEAISIFSTNMCSDCRAKPRGSAGRSKGARRYKPPVIDHGSWERCEASGTHYRDVEAAIDAAECMGGSDGDGCSDTNDDY